MLRELVCKLEEAKTVEGVLNKNGQIIIAMSNTGLDQGLIRFSFLPMTIYNESLKDKPNA